MPDLLYANGLVLYSGSEGNFRLVGRSVKEGSIYEISVNGKQLEHVRNFMNLMFELMNNVHIKRNAEDFS